MSNWLVCLHELGEFSEMDLMQERHNYFLEDHAQHKGKEFNDPFYRNILSMNVHHFIHLKDEMEQAVSLKLRTKKHGVTDLTNELVALLKLLREAEVNQFRPGRNEGFKAIDDFAQGYQILGEKIKKFITRTTAFSNIIGEPQDAGELREMPTTVEDEWDEAQQDCLPDSARTTLPPRMRLINDEFYIVGGLGKSSLVK